MNKIHKLSESVVTKIAAGEVIERPASVVKELVENSIDAGATEIRVEVVDGGRRLIRVVDDGSGMDHEGALLAIERHATSKIQTEEDLFRIRTLGFRGEALPSIAAVSMMVIETSPRSPPFLTKERGLGGEVGSGTRIEIEGGKVQKVVSCGRAAGTTVEVRNLFFNTPARLKFLKSPETESSHISRWIEGIALAYPEIGFTLKGEIDSPPRRSFLERIRDVVGAEISSGLLPVSLSRSGMELTGFISDHQITSAKSDRLFFFVNRRWVRDRMLYRAVLDAYENLLMKNRYPWAFLSLSLPPDRVDVNVHPTKAEVRFAQGNLVYDLVREGVKKALGVSPSPFDGRGWFEQGENRERVTDGPRPLQERPSTFLEREVRILGQVHGTYLVCETAEKLILIDQHAAHERIGFEKLKREFEKGEVARQAWLVPRTFDLKPSEAEVLRLYLDDLKRFGLEIESFGRTSFIVRAVPVLLAAEDPVSLVVDLIEKLSEEGQLRPLEEKVHEVLETIACHRQVRAGDSLSIPEIEELLRQMGETPYSYSCPHGRPVVIEIPFTELEKMFRRRT